VVGGFHTIFIFGGSSLVPAFAAIAAAFPPQSDIRHIGFLASPMYCGARDKMAEDNKPYIMNKYRRIN
jgi:hypothetical protein